MEYLHTMIRVQDLNSSLDFYIRVLGLVEVRRSINKQYENTTVWLAAPEDLERAHSKKSPVLELTHYWGASRHRNAESFGHVAFRVHNIYADCARVLESGYQLHRPPRDGYLAYLKSPDGIAIELIQAGESAAACEPWISMKDLGTW